jgi:uncharacterized Zn finger protein
MARWDKWQRYPASRPRKAVDGIEARSKRGGIGDTWWSRRFVEVLESFGMGARLTRGRRYARSGQVMDLRVASGAVSARVQGSRARAYKVRLELEPLDDAEWSAAIELMAKQAVFAARLLAGEMPDEIEGAFTEAGLSLFPRGTRDLGTACSCPDWANPCKHVAATLYILAEQFDRDPWAILAWRGRTREQVLAQMRELRGAGSPGDAARPPTCEPLPTPAEHEVGAWYGGESGRLEEARRAVTAAWAEPPGTGDALRDLLGPTGVELAGRDLSEWLRAVYDRDEEGEV